jgi:hypothetical protein
MIDSLVGLALGLGAYAILANVNPNLLTLNPGKIYMINRVTFYHVVYCNDLLNKSAKLMDAGPPDAPLGYSEQLKKTDFDKTISEAKCGNEYFIEGADSLAVCMGQACGSGSGGLCINCSTGLGKDCKSSSTVEHSCADCKFGGNVVTSRTFKPEEVWLYLFCEDREGGKLDMSAKELANVDLTTGDETVRSTASASGYVTNYCIKKFSMSPEAIQEFADDCKAKTGLNMGMVGFVKIDMDWKGNGLDVFNSLKMKFSNMKSNTTETKIKDVYDESGVLIMAGPVFGSLVIDANRDNAYFPLNKTVCSSNILDTSVGMNEGLADSVLLMESATFNKLFEAYAYADPTSYTFFVKNAWSIDEAKDIVKNGTKSACGFNAN